MIDIIYACLLTTHEDNFVYYEPQHDERDWWLLLVTKSPAFFIVDNERFEVLEHTAILYPPYVHLHYGALGEPFVNDWVRFRTDEDFILNGTIPAQTPFQVKDIDFIHNLFRQIASENFFDNKYKIQSIYSLFRLMFYKLEESLCFSSETHQLKDLLALRSLINNNPGFDWNVTYMAGKLHISPGYLHELYRNAFGISCMDDVIQMRLALAKHYLENSTMPINSIALTCGYKNVEHFSRQFKKLSGMSPRVYRNTYLAGLT